MSSLFWFPTSLVECLQCQDIVNLTLSPPSAEKRFLFQRTGDHLLEVLRTEVFRILGITPHRKLHLHVASTDSASVLGSDDDIWGLQDGDVIILNWRHVTEGQRKGL